MKELVKEIVRPVAEENGWDYTMSSVTTQFNKDGYEIWFGNKGFELTIKDPETRERNVIFEQRENEGTAFFYAVLLYIIENAEKVVAQCE